MELRRAPAPASPKDAASPLGEPGGIQTIRRTLRREAVTELPPTVAVAARTLSTPARGEDRLAPAEVERIAEKVYRQIEQRLRSEKMRRGM